MSERLNSDRLNNDFQFIESKTNTFDSTVATGINMPKETLDLSGDMPRLVLDAADRAYLADPSKYYWSMMSRVSELRCERS